MRHDENSNCLKTKKKKKKMDNTLDKIALVSFFCLTKGYGGGGGDTLFSH